MPDLSYLQNKAATLAGYLDDLAVYRDLPVDEYLSNTEKRRSVERTIEIIVQCSVDINHALLFAAQRPAPASYYDSFVDLIPAGLLPTAQAKRLASAAGLRNRLAHE